MLQKRNFQGEPDTHLIRLMKTTKFQLILCLGLLSNRAHAGVLPEGDVEKRPIMDVFVDVAQIHHDAKSNGDTWDHIWAGNDTLYSFGCDCVGYGTCENNVNFNKLVGASWDNLAGSSVNSMSDYGKKMERIANGSNWKVTGADCIDGVFYVSIADHW